MKGDMGCECGVWYRPGAAVLVQIGTLHGCKWTSALTPAWLQDPRAPHYDILVFYSWVFSYVRKLRYRRLSPSARSSHTCFPVFGFPPPIR